MMFPLNHGIFAGQTGTPAPLVVALSDAEEGGDDISQTRAIPEQTIVGDMIIACLLHRGTLENIPAGFEVVEAAGPFTAPGFTLNQYTSILIKVASSSDAGSEVTFSTASSGQLASQLIVVRGGTSVVSKNNFVDESTLTKNLLIAETTADPMQLAIACVTCVYQISTYPRILNGPDGWIKTSPTRVPNNVDKLPTRMGVAYKLISEAETISGSFERGYNIDDPGYGSATIVIGGGAS